MTIARAALVACLMLAGCAAETHPPAGDVAATPAAPRTATFACEDGSSLTVQFESGTATATVTNGRTVHLAQQETGSGILYEGDGYALRGKGQEMTWTAADGTSLACSAAKSPLTGTRWQLVQFQSPEDAIGVEKPAYPERYVMELQVGGRLALQLDCNRATGRWTAYPASPTDGLISLAAPAMTRAACLPGSWDTRLARDLAYVHSYTLEGDRLHLALKIDSGIYTWRRMSP
jgi:membrane-bound inhibitor of C-type lysozyme